MGLRQAAVTGVSFVRFVPAAAVKAVRLVLRLVRGRARRLLVREDHG